MNENNLSKLISLLQFLSALGMSGLILYVLIISLKTGRIESQEVIFRFLPVCSMLICSIFPIFILRLKHRFMSVEGSFIPLYLFGVTMSAISFAPDMSELLAVQLIPFVFNQKIARFFFLSSAVAFLYASIADYDVVKTIKNPTLCAVSTILSVFLISFLMPVNSNLNTVNKHEVELLVTILVLMIMALLTYLASYLKDKEIYELKRLLTFFFLGFGHFLILVFNYPISFVGAAMYIIGIIMLCVVNPNGY